MSGTITPAYGLSYGRGFAGMVPDARLGEDVSRVSEEASAAIGFGRFVKGGTDPDEQALIPTAVTNRLLGLAKHRHNESGDIPAGEELQVRVLGSLMVTSETAVTKNDPVFCRITAGSTESVGACRNDSDSGDARRVPNVFFDETIGAAGLARVRIEGPCDELPPLEVLAEFNHAQVTADDTTKLFKTKADEFVLIERAEYNNPTGLAQDATNYFTIKVVHGATPTVAASRNTLTGGGGSLSADTPVDLTNGTAANRMVPPSTQVSLLLDEDGTATLPAGRIVVWGRRY